MADLNELHVQLKEAETRVNELREKLLSQQKTERIQAITAAKELIKLHGLTISELGFSGKTKDSTAARKTNDKRSTVAAKYRDPKTGQTWTGRGKTPAWLSAELTTGGQKQDFLIPA